MVVTASNGGKLYYFCLMRQLSLRNSFAPPWKEIEFVGSLDSMNALRNEDSPQYQLSYLLNMSQSQTT